MRMVFGLIYLIISNQNLLCMNIVASPSSTQQKLVMDHGTLEYGASALHSLLKAGVNPNTVDHHGNTLLHFPKQSVGEGHLKLLLKYGFDIDRQNQWGRTPLMEYIRHVNGRDMVEDIILCSGNVNVQDHDGKTALHHALELGLFWIAATLRDNTNADFTIADNQGKKPIDILSAYTLEELGFFYGDYNDWYGTKKCTSSKLFGENGYLIKELLYKQNDKNYSELDRIHKHLQAMPVQKFLKKIKRLDEYTQSLFYSLRSGKAFLFIVKKEKRRRKIKQARAIKEYIAMLPYDNGMSQVD